MISIYSFLIFTLKNNGRKMSLNPRTYLQILPGLACIMFTSFPVTAQELNMTGKPVTVYTTADSTTLRLTQTGKLTFENAVQPLETEVCVFVNPKKEFQSFIGIGSRKYRINKSWPANHSFGKRSSVSRNTG